MLTIDTTMQFQNEEEEVLEVNDTEDESGATTEESTEESEGEDSELVEVDDTVTISRTELEKLQRESHAAKRLRERKEKVSDKDSEGAQTLDQDLIERTFLAAQMQILDSDVQDEAMRLKEKLGFDSIAKAVSDPDVKMRLDNLIKQKKVQQSVAGGTGGSVQKGRGIEYHVAEYKRTGKLPDDNRLVAQILDKLV